MTTSLDLLREQEQQGGSSKYYPGLVLLSGMTKEIQDGVKGISVGDMLNRKTKESKPSFVIIPLNYRIQYIALKLDANGKKTKNMDFGTYNKDDSRLVGKVFTGPDKNVQIKHIYTVVTEDAPTELLDYAIPNNSHLPAQWVFRKLILDSGEAIWANKYKVYGEKLEGKKAKTMQVASAGSVDKKAQEGFAALALALENPTPSVQSTEGDSTEVPF